MGYRGEDLDLRTAQPRSGQGGEDLVMTTREFLETTSGRGEPSAPIYVDDTLLAVCNHAYDVALAHRAADVRLEHLLYALTRIDAAAEVLEAAGIRDASLRREGAAIVASEIPIGLTNGNSKPRRSSAFEQSLRLAAEQGYRRNRAASVADLLHVFLEVKPDLPGLELLRRHVSQSYVEEEYVAPSRNYSSRPVRFEQPLYVESRPERRHRHDDFDYGEERFTHRVTSQEATDAMQNSRLRVLEDMVRDLGDKLSAERQSFGRILTDVQREVSTQRGGDGGHAMRELLERFTATDHAMANRIEELGRRIAVVHDQVEELKSFRVSGEGGEVIADFSPLLERLDAVERRIEARLENDEVFERLTGIEKLVQTRPDAVSIDLSHIETRLGDIESAVVTSTSFDGVASESRIEQLEELVRARLSEVHAAITSVRGVDNDTVSTLHAELHQIRDHLSGTDPNAQRELLSSVLHRLNEVTGQLNERLGELEARLQKTHEESVGGRADFVRELGDVHEAIMKLNANQHAISSSIETWREDSSSSVREVSHRLGILDQRIGSGGFEEIQRLSANLDRMYRVTVERYHRRNRFWFWLFGTDDWIGASWPSQTARVEQELRALKQSQGAAAE